MIGLGEVFTTLLRDAPTVVEMVGDRIGPRKIKQGKKTPAIRYLMVVSNPWADLSGTSAMADTVFQVNCVGDGEIEAGRLAELVRQKLLSSAVGASNAGGEVTIKSIRQRAQYSVPYADSGTGGDDGAFTEALEFFVQHTLPPVEG